MLSGLRRQALEWTALDLLDTESLWLTMNTRARRYCLPRSNRIITFVINAFVKCLTIFRKSQYPGCWQRAKSCALNDTNCDAILHLGVLISINVRVSDCGFLQVSSDGKVCRNFSDHIGRLSSWGLRNCDGPGLPKCHTVSFQSDILLGRSRHAGFPIAGKRSPGGCACGEITAV